jgi:hypothetical protein
MVKRAKPCKVMVSFVGINLQALVKVSMMTRIASNPDETGSPTMRSYEMISHGRDSIECGCREVTGGWRFGFVH